MINYLSGLTGNGKSEYIYKCIKNNMTEKIQSYILVPEQYSMQQEQELLKNLGFDSQKYAGVLTFSRLSNMILSAKGPLRMKYIDGAGKNMLALRSLLLCEKKLTFFSRNVHQKGFPSVLVSLFSEFKRYGVTIDLLSDAADKIENAELKNKLYDFEILYTKYNELLSENNSDAEDNLKIIISKISECNFLKGKIYINHFKSFTPVEYEAISELLKIADVTFSLVSDSEEKEEGAFRSAKLTLKKLRKISESLGIPEGEFVYLKEDIKFSKNKELLFLKENCLSFAPEKFKEKPENIRIIRPRTYYDEICEAAQNIVHLMRTKQYSPEDFLVLISNAENYADTLPVVFEKYGLSCFIDNKNSFSSKPFIRFLLSVLEILAYGFSYERIITCLRAGFLPVKKQESDLFENYLLATAPPKNRLSSENSFTYNPDSEKFSLDTINSIKERSIDLIITLSKSIKGRKTAGKICDTFNDWLVKSNVKTIFEQNLHSFIKNGDTETAKEYESVWNTFASVFAQIEDMFSDTFVTYTEFYKLFSAAVSDIKLGKTPSLTGQITISEVENFRSTSSKVVFLLGANDGEFPRNIPEDGLISDKERNVLSENNLILAPTAYDKLFDEQYLVYLVLTAPSEKLIITAPVASMEGKELAPSEIISTVKNIFPKLSEEYSKEENINILTLLEGQNAAFEKLIKQLCLAKGNKALMPFLWQKVYDYFSENEKFKKMLVNIEKAIAQNETSEELSKKTAELLYGNPLMLSVSKLEKYNACALSYFLTYGLFADERKKAAVLSNDTGSALHETLAVYFERKNKENADYSAITRASVKKEIEKIIDENLSYRENALFETSSYYRYTLLRIKDIASVTAWKIVRFYAQSSFRPYGFEIKIGKNGVFDSYTIRLENSEAKINGYIDRMDISKINGKNYFNIIDYKSSEKKIDPDLAECGVRFQPLLYAGIVKENIENSSPAAMLYMQMEDPVVSFDSAPDEADLEKKVLDKVSLKGLVLNDDEVVKNLDADIDNKKAVHFVPTSKNSKISSAEMDMMLKKAIDTAKETSQKISDGEIEINPVFIKGKFDACEYCKFGSCCKNNEE